MRRLGGIGGLGLAATLAACATAPLPPLPPTTPLTPQPPGPLPVSALPGWDQEDHLQALKALAAACRRPGPLAAVCAALNAAPPATDAEARSFLEARLQAVPLPGQGLLTAYFAPVYDGRTAPEAPFTAAVRPIPPKPADGAPLPDRADIDAWPTDGALAYMRPEDLFFLQLQGSGVLVLADGTRLKLAYAGSNDRPYVSIARAMLAQGLIDDAHSSGDAIRAWLAAHRGPEADAILHTNPRYAFFSARPDDGQEPAGAAGIPLPPGRALAVDPAHNPLGGLYYIDAEGPRLAGAIQTYRRVAAGLDTGAAIKGQVRADLYIGSGEAAGREAGRVRHTLTLYRLEPRP